jgi:hypothetical protein
MEVPSMLPVMVAAGTLDSKLVADAWEEVSTMTEKSGISASRLRLR